MENIRENFRAKIYGDETLNVGDLVDVTYPAGDTEPALVAEITSVKRSGKTSVNKQVVYWVTGVVEFVNDIAEYDDDMVAYVFAA